MNFNRRKQAGFTLIEIIVASVILFSSIAAATMIYRGAVLSSLKAEASIETSGSIAVILSNIQQVIRTTNHNGESLSGQGQVFNIKYSWQANVLEVGSAPPKLDVDNGNYENQRERYYFWQVDLDVSRDDRNETFSYNEVSWN